MRYHLSGQPNSLDTSMKQITVDWKSKHPHPKTNDNCLNINSELNYLTWHARKHEKIRSDRRRTCEKKPRAMNREKNQATGAIWSKLSTESEQRLTVVSCCFADQFCFFEHGNCTNNIRRRNNNKTSSATGSRCSIERRCATEHLIYFWCCASENN